MGLISEKKVKIRKNHMCGMCLRQFLPSTQMTCQIITDGGKIYSFYICQTCEKIMPYIDLEEYPEGCVQEEINQYFNGETPEEYLKALKDSK